MCGSALKLGSLLINRMGDSNDEAAVIGDLAARITSVESSLSNIETTLQRFLATQNQTSNGNTSASQGERPQEGRSFVSLQGGQGQYSEVPSFIPVSSSTSSQGTQAQGLPTIILPLQGMASVNNETLVLNPQQLLSQFSAPAIAVMSRLPPVPGYIANMIQKNKYVDFALLR